MDKLIGLLNERIREKRNELSSTIGEPVDVGIYEYDKLEECITYDGYGVSDECIISKKEGFIEWLVENDKINFSLIPNKIKEIGIPMKINGEIKYGFDSSDYYWLLMLLAIQDEPIDFLIEILK